mmetsp:Transcript_7519/g.17226  ORF Transcript_7519/g.17226 Transcript_7519/m.17226 type:complete len:524 (-) Transcript_7519:455-2026(-)
MHAAPRFGHSDQFSDVFSDSGSERDDYLNGLFFIGAFVLAIFFTWLLALSIMRCLGPRRVGFFSGARMSKPPHVVDYPRPFRVRTAFMLAALLFYIFSILMATKGAKNFQDTVIIASDSNDEVKVLLQEAEVITTSLQEVGQSSGEIRDGLVASLGNFCPGDSNVDQTTGQNFDAMAQEAADLLGQLGDFINNDVVEVQKGIDRAQDTTQEIDDVLREIDADDWQSITVIIPYIIVPSLLVVAVMMAMFDATLEPYERAVVWLIMPLFMVIIVLTIFACAATSWAAVINADFCSGGADKTPDATVREILDAQNFEQTDIVYESVVYYTSQCNTKDPFAFVDEYQVQIDAAQKTVGAIITSLEAVTVARLSLLCGKDFGPFLSSIRLMQTNLVTLGENAASAQNLLSCERILPIYTNAIYDGVCGASISGLTWTFSSLLVLSTMGVIMIMLRSSYLEVDYYVDDKAGGTNETTPDMYNAQEEAYPKRMDYEEDYGTSKQPPEQAVGESGVERVYLDEPPRAQPY